MEGEGVLTNLVSCLSMAGVEAHFSSLPVAIGIHTQTGGGVT